MTTLYQRSVYGMKRKARMPSSQSMAIVFHQVENAKSKIITVRGKAKEMSKRIRGIYAYYSKMQVYTLPWQGARLVLWCICGNFFCTAKSKNDRTYSFWSYYFDCGSFERVYEYSRKECRVMEGDDRVFRLRDGTCRSTDFCRSFIAKFNNRTGNAR